MATSERDLEKIFKALGNRRRLSILRILKKDGKLSVGDIASEIDMSIKATSKHVAILAGAGLLDREKHGLGVWYGISNDLVETSRKVLLLL